MATKSPEQRFNDLTKDLIGKMKKLADGRKDTAELYVLERKYSIATSLDNSLLLSIIDQQEFFLTYGDQIATRDEDFFMNADFAEQLQKYERSAGYRKGSYREWLSIIDILRRVWQSVDDKTRESLWDAVEQLYETYLEYVDGRQSAKK